MFPHVTRSLHDAIEHVPQVRQRDVLDQFPSDRDRLPLAIDKVPVSDAFDHEVEHRVEISEVSLGDDLLHLPTVDHSRLVANGGSLASPDHFDEVDVLLHVLEFDAHGISFSVVTGYYPVGEFRQERN